MIQIHSGVLFISALLLLLLPLDWVAAAVTAAILHELMHIIALYAFNGRILKIQVQAGGCMIETDSLGEWSQFFSILAGPLGSFSLLLLRHCIPKIAIFGLFQGVYNLFPVMPLDGGRLLRLLLNRFCPNRADLVMDCVAFGSCILVDFAAIVLSTMTSMGLWPFMAAFAWNLKLLPRKTPCKA